MIGKDEYLTDDEVREIKFLKRMKEKLCKDCQNIIDEELISIILS